MAEHILEFNNLPVIATHARLKHRRGTTHSGGVDYAHAVSLMKNKCEMFAQRDSIKDFKVFVCSDRPQLMREVLATEYFKDRAVTTDNIKATGIHTDESMFKAILDFCMLGHCDYLIRNVGGFGVYGFYRGHAHRDTNNITGLGKVAAGDRESLWSKHNRLGG